MSRNSKGARTCPVQCCHAHTNINADNLNLLRQRKEVQICEHINVLATGHDQCMICGKISSGKLSREHPCFRKEGPPLAANAKTKKPCSLALIGTRTFKCPKCDKLLAVSESCEHLTVFVRSDISINIMNSRPSNLSML